MIFQNESKDNTQLSLLDANLKRSSYNISRGEKKHGSLYGANV